MYTTHPTIHRSNSPYPGPAGTVSPGSAERDPWHEQLSDASVLPEQFFNPRASFFTGHPIAALLQAVLEDALKCFQSQFLFKGGHLRQEAREATAWFWSEEERWPFSFITVCTVLGLEPEAIRQQLKRWSHSHPPQRKMRRITTR